MRLFRVFAVLLLVFTFSSLSAQVEKPVSWKKYIRHVSGNQYDIVFSATIKSGWYVYSQDLVGDGGPVPTMFEFTMPQGVEKIGKTKESGNKKTGYDATFKMDITKYAKKVTFKQRIKVQDPYRVYNIKGAWEFMTCNDSKCLPPDYKEFKLKTKPLTKQATKPVVNNNTSTETKPRVVERAPARPSTGSISSKAGLPVQWQVEGVRVSKDEYDITFKANVKSGWELYSPYTGSKGPMPLSFEYDNRDERLEPYKRIKTDAENRIRNVDDKFGVTLTRYQDEVSFTQRVKIEKGSRSVKGDLNYVAAQAGDNTILSPQRIGFSINLPSKITPTEAMLKKQAREREREALALAKKQEEEGEGDDETESEGDDEGEDALVVENNETENVNTAAPEGAIQLDGTIFNYEYAYENCNGEGAANYGSNLWVFLLGLGSGFIALLTPCIFPMIPVTVGFFTKRSRTRAEGIGNALIYGLSIITIFVTLGMVVTGTLGADTLNLWSTGALFNFIFFFVFVLFAFSFFGFFELTLPSSWSTWSDDASDKGGLLGIFFMAFTLSLVSFSCTGPIIGTLLAQTADGTGATILGRIPVKPLLGMLGFSTALALPFALFAMFPSWLNNLPKSGGWMNTVKVFLGFLELALALKFLSTADLVYHTGILKIELFLGLWILIFGGMAAYMLGFLKLPLDYGKPQITRGRYITGLASLAFVIYLASGLFTYKPLTVLSGIAPPVTYNFFRNEANLDYPNCPQNIRCFKDYDEALAFAKERNLPVMIDFTGHGCVNCREMEATVWAEPAVLQRLSEDYILLALYVDDPTTLPEDQWIKAKDGKTKKTIGKINANFQIERFNNNAQPYYVLLDTEGEMLIKKPKAYDLNPANFVEYLDIGLAEFNKR